MFLYELAIELGVRSVDLVDRAHRLGLTGLGSTSTLTAAQVEALRTDAAARASGPPAGAVAGPPPIAAPPAWRTAAPAEPPPSPAPAAPEAVPTFPAPAPPSEPLTAPSGWGAPALPPAPAGDAAAGPAHGSAPPNLPPPPAMAPAGPEAVPTFLAPGTPDWDAAGPALAVGPLGDPASVSGGPPPVVPAGEPGWSKGGLAAVGLVALAILGLFAYMALNTGPDEATKRRVDAARAREAAAAEREANRPTTTLPPTTAPTTISAPTTTSAPKQHPGLPVDAEAFCTGARGMTAFELRMAAAMIDADLSALKELVVEDQVEAWGESVDLMVSAGAPNLMTDLEFYRAQYLDLFGILRRAATIDDALVGLQSLAQDDLAGAAWRINNEIGDVCAA